MRESTRRHRPVWLALTLLWLAVTAAGLAGMAAYANRPGQPAQAPASWPNGSSLVLDAARPTLVMVLHPQCDCSRASLAELRELVARAPNRARVFTVFIHPAGVGDGWEETDLWRSAGQIPDVVRVKDEGGREASRFGAATSGQTLLYDPSGALAFSGGTTIARGHEGENPGLAAILDVLQRGRADSHSTPVFGCPLFDPSQGRQQGT